jgi:hypothetical protein
MPAQLARENYTSDAADGCGYGRMQLPDSMYGDHHRLMAIKGSNDISLKQGRRCAAK